MARMFRVTFNVGGSILTGVPIQEKEVCLGDCQRSANVRTLSWDLCCHFVIWRKINCFPTVLFSTANDGKHGLWRHSHQQKAEISHGSQLVPVHTGCTSRSGCANVLANPLILLPYCVNTLIVNNRLHCLLGAFLRSVPQPVWTDPKDPVHTTSTLKQIVCVNVTAIYNCQQVPLLPWCILRSAPHPVWTTSCSQSVLASNASTHKVDAGVNPFNFLTQ